MAKFRESAKPPEVLQRISNASARVTAHTFFSP